MLNELIEKGLKYSPEYKKGLSNHLPMALVALEKLGANDERLKAFYDFYIRKLEPKNESNTTGDNNAFDQLGTHQYFETYRMEIEKDFKSMGLEASLRKYLPKLMPGVAGGSFHPMIRVAYGIDSSNENEIIEGLAYWFDAYLSLGKKVEADEKKSVGALIRSVGSDSHFQQLKPQGYGIFGRMKVVGEDENFSKVSSSLDSANASVKDFATAALEVYLSTDDDFTALHLVTGCHAYRIVEPFIENKEESFECLWRAICAAYITMKVPQIESVEIPHVLPPWEKIFLKAKESNDDHVIKFAHTCFEEHEAYGDERYRFAISKKIKLV